MDRAQKKIDILLVEDDPVFAKLVQDVLRSGAAPYIEFVMESTFNSNSAIQLISQKEFQLILLDLGLPDSRDEETFSKISVAARHIPIVLLTSNEDETLALDLIKQGAQDYLFKSALDLKMLPRIIQYAIERNRVLKELKVTHDQLKVTQAQLVQAEKMESIGKLAVGIAHEVKNPIAIVQQCVEFLSHADIFKEPNIQSVMNDMTESIDRADRIIQELLHLSSPPDSGSNRSFETVNALLDGVLTLLKHEISKRNVNVAKRYENSLGPIFVNKNSVEQILMNLILNALESMKDGGDLILTTQLKKKDEITSFQVVEIKDRGIGIAPDVQPRLFEPFFTTKKTDGGTGLGLSVVKNVMEIHRGLVEIKNNTDGKGATATLMFRVPTF